MTTQEELDHLLDLLKQEKEEESRQFDELLKELSIQQRIQKGACWYPVQIESSGWSLGEHPFIVVERTKHIDKPHKFRSGQVVSIFSEKVLGDNTEEKGVIYFIKRNRMKIILYGTQLPRWILGGKIGIQLNFDERSYQEMERAVKMVKAAKNDRLAELREVLLGKTPPLFDREHHYFEIPHLNKSQNDAVQNILAAEDVAIIHGPPGTGKTTTIVAAIQQLVKRESPILVCAPSNSATDLLTEKLAQTGLNVVRIGNVSRVDESLLQHTMEGILQALPEIQEVKKMKIEAAKVRRNAEKFKRKFGAKERQDRRDNYREAKDLMYQAKMLEDYIIDKTLREADVICSTLVGAVSRHIEKMTFNTIIIDEAAQALEPATWIPICKAQKVVLAGDPFQLPPTVKSITAAKNGFSTTLLEKGVQRLENVNLLDTQYRMHNTIMGFSNQQFYDLQLKADTAVATWQLLLSDGSPSAPMEFIDTAGCGFEEKVNPESQSYYNPEEYFVLRQHLDNLLVIVGDQPISIGIISPYREQVVAIQDAIVKDFDHFPDANIEVNTIDAFQGQERDVIYISMVRSNDAGEIGFLKDTRRMNVAMTRAKKKLIIIGDSATLASFPFYSHFLDYVDAKGAYGSAWDWQ
ncbi:AAA domain-containing protein [Aureispira anguillae]|uniref:AAA domain-containing protein n=1 Tax=Aureispira anguillae TaxID=2864201 RepID=A0A915YKX4_9BACT|nr:AAA domain-containing protein [Aureispira anguillae]BDS14842.1 AAA domain-containing protein [Aureispira anguillae]